MTASSSTHTYVSYTTAGGQYAIAALDSSGNPAWEKIYSNSNSKGFGAILFGGWLYSCGVLDYSSTPEIIRLRLD